MEPSSLDLYLAVRKRYQLFLEAVALVQDDIRNGVIESSPWPHADAVSARMGVAPDEVRQVVADWDRFVDVALIDFGEGDAGVALADAIREDKATLRFLDREATAETLGDLLERYRRAPDPPWEVSSLWYLIGTGEATVSSTIPEVRAVLADRRCERVRERRPSFFSR